MCLSTKFRYIMHLVGNINFSPEISLEVTSVKIFTSSCSRGANKNISYVSEDNIDENFANMQTAKGDRLCPGRCTITTD